MSFTADFPGAIVVEARNYGYSGYVNRPRAIGLHTPEEPADETPFTPTFFHNTTANASTQYFVSFLGFVFQCVPESEGAYGNALEGKKPPAWADWPSPSTFGGWLNLQTISIEIEGYARSIHQTMPRGSAQWVSLVRLMADICRRLPGVNIEWTFGHYQVSTLRSDPGQLDVGTLIADVKLLLGGLSMAFDDEAKKFLDSRFANVLNALNTAVDDRRVVVRSAEFKAIVQSAVAAELAKLPPGTAPTVEAIKAAVKAALKEGTG